MEESIGPAAQAWPASPGAGGALWTVWGRRRPGPGRPSCRSGRRRRRRGALRAPRRRRRGTIDGRPPRSGRPVWAGSRFGDGLALVRRAELWELRSRECYLTDHSDEAIEAIERALGLRRMLGDKLGGGRALRWLSQILWCPGRTGEAERAALHAVRGTRGWSAGRELAMAYANLAATCSSSARIEESIAWASRALELAERLGDTETAVHALSTIGINESGETGTTRLQQALERAQQAELPEQAGRTFTGLALMAVGAQRGHGQPLHSRGDRLLQRSRAGTVPAVPTGLPVPPRARPGTLVRRGGLGHGGPAHPPHLDHPAHDCPGGARPRPGQTGRSRTSSSPRRGVGPRPTIG